MIKLASILKYIFGSIAPFAAIRFSDILYYSEIAEPLKPILQVLSLALGCIAAALTICAAAIKLIKELIKEFKKLKR